MSLLQKFIFGNNVKVFIRAASSFTKSAESVYRYQLDESDKWPKPTNEMKNDYEKNGFILVKNLLSERELNSLLPALHLSSGKVGKHVKDLDDLDHRVTQNRVAIYEKLGFFKHDHKWGLVLWNEQGKDCLGVLAGNAKIAGIAQQLLNRGDIYLYHGKLLRKEAKQGGAADWHQDYASWYQNELIFPDLVAVTIALTKSDRENGGTEVIKGSQNCGRIDHNVTRVQQGADQERVSLLQKVLPQVPLDVVAGDGVFMHPNLLRASGPNPSQHLRCHLKFVFNSKQNSPAIKHDYSDAVYTPLEMFEADSLEKLTKYNVEQREWRQTEKDKMEGLGHETVWDL